MARTQSTISPLAAAILAAITPKADGTMPLTRLPIHWHDEYDAAERELLQAGLAYRFEGALQPASAS